MKRILIFSASIGNGHNQAARAIQEELSNLGYASMIIDTLEYISPTFHKILLEGFTSLLKLSPSVWGKIYHNTEKTRVFDMNVIFNKMLANNLKKLIASVEPDGFIATHPFASCMLSILKGRNNWKEPIYTVITDYTIHPSWVNHHITNYFIASDQLFYLVDLYKQDHQKFIPTGIPIMQKYRQELDREALLEKFQIKPEQKVLLLSGGGLGLGPMERVLEGLDGIKQPLKIFVLTGINEKLYRNVNSHTYSQEVVARKYIDNFHEYLEVSDAIVSKSGGLTTAEVMSKQVPMIIFNPLPGQEERNSHFLLNNSCAIHATESQDLIYSIEQLLSDDHMAQQMQENAGRIAKPYAALEIALYIKKAMESENEYTN
ncbi:MGDG synthase family glycosyltransferase [Brevibacillus daliensis]|uniref:MGDG synthase family glycosyltransferase n=1 Tax=Brevibacillus daliensis TaxID=2892995 RepID=UPI001E589F81|nr:glycosyltransferase [Brevibacillus daliensis]